MVRKDYTMDELQKIADEVIDMLRPKHLTIADVRDVLKLIDEGLEFEELRELTE